MQAGRTAPAAGGRSSPTSAGGPSRARRAATASAPPGLGPRAFGFRPWLSHNPTNQYTDTITKAATRRQHWGGRTRGPQRGWQSAHLPGRGHGRPSRPDATRGQADGGKSGGALRCYSLSSGNWSSSAILNEPRRFFKGCPPRCIVGRRLSLRGRFECGARCPRCGAPRRYSRRCRLRRARLRPRLPWEGVQPSGAAPRPSAPAPGRAGGRGGRPGRQARLAPPLPGPGAGARGERGERRELPCPARPGSRSAPPAPSGARSRRAFRVSRCSCGNCRLFIPSGEKEGRWEGGPGRLRRGQGGREAAPVGPARGEAPGSRPHFPRGFYPK